MLNYKPGGIAYIIENNQNIREATILRTSGNFVTIKFSHSDSAATIRKSRLFSSYQDAILRLPKRAIKERNTHYDYESKIDLFRG